MESVEPLTKFACRCNKYLWRSSQGNGLPTASRAVARACAANPVAVVIPCHRVVPAAGGIGGYRWGSKRKAQILNLERQK